MRSLIGLTATSAAASLRRVSRFSSVDLLGAAFACVDTATLIDHIFAELAAGRGGWVVTANLDILRKYVCDVSLRSLYGAADVIVADGMPLVWAARLQGTPLPERVAGASLVPLLFARAEREGRTVYLLGGAPAATRDAVARLAHEHPRLRVLGHDSPMLSAQPTAAEIAPMRAALAQARPDLVLLAFGSPKQEYVIASLRDAAPCAWWLGVGISLSFYAGHVRRAPVFLQRAGLEWIHRLVQEPRRLFRRYIIDDLPFALRLLGGAAHKRFSRPS